MASRVFTGFRLGGLTLRNRFVRSAAFEGMSQGGLPGEQLVDYHGSVARGGVGMTTVAYVSVSQDGLTYPHQMCIRTDGVAMGLRRLTDAVHAEGAAAAIQIGHAGYFSDRGVTGVRPMGASAVLNLYGLSMPRAMSEADIERVARDFRSAARLALEAGFDAIELQMCHGYLLSQFLSPHTNRRADRWGGSLENRLRFPLEVARQVRGEVGPSAALVAKVNLRDGFAGGLEIEESVEICRRLEAEGLDALVVSGGFVSKVPMYVMRGDVPFKDMYEGQTRIVKKAGLMLLGRLLVKRFPFREAYFLEDALAVRRAVRMPLVLVGGLRRLETMEKVADQGFDLLALARPLVMEPDLVMRMQRGEASESRCEPCNRCIAAMDRGPAVCKLL